MQVKTVLIRMGNNEEVGFSVVSDKMSETQKRDMSRVLSLFLLGDQGRKWRECKCCDVEISFDSLEIVSNNGVSNLYRVMGGGRRVYIWFDGGIDKYLTC